MMADEFPLDIIYGILSRLLIKSLARFRCVCKSWLKYINDPYLQTIHVTEEPTPFLGFSSRDTENLRKISLLRVDQGSMTVKKDPVYEFCYKGWSMTLGSCNGLILVCFNIGTSDHDTFVLQLINPLTKQRDTLPPIKIGTTYAHWFDSGATAGFAFDDSTNTLTTVCVILKQPDWSHDFFDVRRGKLCTMVHRSGMSSWRKVAQNPACPIGGEGVFAHGRLHWLASREFFRSPRKIVWFDVKVEEFGLIDFPDLPEMSPEFHYYVPLVDLNGELGFAYDRHNGFHMWILKQEKWVFHCFINYPLALTNLGYEDVMVSDCWNNAGDILLIVDDWHRGKHLLVYTLKTGDLKGFVWDDPSEAKADVGTDVRMSRSSMFSIRGINPSAY
ncbi:F-box/kelch-repeat protein At3g23880-like [Bidens hawaiensis]|uniref:F-box/kelch-repeat protein At3g23880-like n=1 Tax=Bidens hawaiensis TaxID=980011 RepID=UPI00404AFD4B